MRGRGKGKEEWNKGEEENGQEIEKEITSAHVMFKNLEWRVWFSVEFFVKFY
jgi:hypothetical protein